MRLTHRIHHTLSTSPMKRLTCLLIPCFLIAAVVSQSQKTPPNSWQTVKPKGPPFKRHEHAFVKVGSQLVALGGRRIQPVDIFNPKNRTWRTGKRPPLELHHFQALEHNDKVLIAGAFTGENSPGKLPSSTSTFTTSNRTPGKKARPSPKIGAAAPLAPSSETKNSTSSVASPMDIAPAGSPGSMNTTSRPAPESASPTPLMGEITSKPSSSETSSFSLAVADPAKAEASSPPSSRKSTSTTSPLGTGKPYPKASPPLAPTPCPSRSITKSSSSAAKANGKQHTSKSMPSTSPPAPGAPFLPFPSGGTLLSPFSTTATSTFKRAPSPKVAPKPAHSFASPFPRSRNKSIFQPTQLPDTLHLPSPILYNRNSPPLISNSDNEQIPQPTLTCSS